MNRLLFYNKFYKAVVCVLLIIVAISMFTIVTFSSAGFATTESYDLGNYVGCNDAKIADPSDRYINQPGKGPSFHTN